jgi:preprotein translocase subunit SecD
VSDSVVPCRQVIKTEPTDKGAKAPPTSTPTREEIDKAKAARQPMNIDDQAAVRSALDALDCSAADPLRGNDDRYRPLITCDPAMPAKYVLGPSFLTRAEVREARAQLDPSGTGWVVNLSFTDEGATIWGDFTTENVDQQVAILVDTAVLSAPTIQEPILAGDTVINGGVGGFTPEQAEDLAARLRSR